VKALSGQNTQFFSTDYCCAKNTVVFDRDLTDRFRNAAGCPSFQNY